MKICSWNFQEMLTYSMSISKSKQKKPRCKPKVRARWFKQSVLHNPHHSFRCVAKTYGTLLNCYLEKGNLCLEEVKKFGRSYGNILEVMLEHAQMEEGLLLSCSFYFWFFFFSTCGGWPGRKRRAYWVLKNSSAQNAWSLYYFWD